MEWNAIMIVTVIGIMLFIGIILYLAYEYNVGLGALTDLPCRIWCGIKIKLSPERKAVDWVPWVPAMPGGFCSCPD